MFQQDMDYLLVKWLPQDNNDQLHMEQSCYSFQNMGRHIPFHNLYTHIHYQYLVHKYQGSNELEKKSHLDNNSQWDKECTAPHWKDHDSSRKFLQDKDNSNNHKFQRDNNNQIDSFDQPRFHHGDNRSLRDIFHRLKLTFGQVRNFGSLVDIK